MIELLNFDGGWEIRFNGFTAIRHTKDKPFLRAGIGTERIEMYRGNFEIEDLGPEPMEPTTIAATRTVDAAQITVVAKFGEHGFICADFRETDGRLECRFEKKQTRFNRVRLSLPAQADEKIWGCGEQFSHFNLRGRNWPLWTREQGVGRNKETEITKLADRDDRAGGDYHTTFYPQTTFVSSRRYFFHAFTWAYADWDFSASDEHRLTFWEIPERLVWSFQPTLLDAVRDVSALLGRQKELPDWVHDGVILGIQDGTETCLSKLARAVSHGVAVNGIWAQDWVGQRKTSFGKRLNWNWVWNRELYPGLDRTIRELAARGVRFLGYINPYVLEGKSLFLEAEKLGFLALDGKGVTYLVDFGEFDAGLVDFTNPEAADWYRSVIKREMIDFGLSGWMADFGEYLPTDVVLRDGTDAKIAHNEWPGLWARVNAQAIEESGKSDIVFFMRAGNAESLRWCPMMWAGDQNVDWSEDDGLPSVITSALSLAMSGMGLQHSDIGGYTTLYSLRRTKELFLRWAEFAACTPMMRTHEGNRPVDNWQFDSDDETLDGLARSTALFRALKDYRKHAVAENAESGIPVMRPLVLHYEDPAYADVKDEYLLGRDLLVAPVVREGETERTLLVPDGVWTHVWTGKKFEKGPATVSAPIGEIPLFWREGSSWTELFSTLGERIAYSATSIVTDSGLTE